MCIMYSIYTYYWYYVEQWVRKHIKTDCKYKHFLNDNDKRKSPFSVYAYILYINVYITYFMLTLKNNHFSLYNIPYATRISMNIYLFIYIYSRISDVHKSFIFTLNHTI